MRVFKRADLFANYEAILLEGLGKAYFKHYQMTKGHFGPGTIAQVSSGKTDKKVLRIPRLLLDFQDSMRRLLIPYKELFRIPPERVAILGGAFHTETSFNFQLKLSTCKSFTLKELSELQTFDPEVLICYPSMMRDILARPLMRLPTIKCCILGGETLFECDVVKIRKRFGGIAIFEQFGSVEMPIYALGTREPEVQRKLALQSERYSFDFGDSNSFQPLYIKDNFPKLLFPIHGFYDTEHDILSDGKYLFEIKQRNDPGLAYLPIIETLLKQGVHNAQIKLEQNEILVEAEKLPVAKIQTEDGKTLKLRLAKLERLPLSEKLELVSFN